MNTWNQFYLLLAFIISSTKQDSSQEINSNWPEDDSVPFPYPTPVPLAIDSSKVKKIKTPTALRVIINPLQFSFTANNGDTLISKAVQPVKMHITGGVLYNDTYRYFQCGFHWNNDLKPDAGDTIDGKGQPLQAVVSFWNTKYSSITKAIKKRDGVASIVVPIDVGPISSFLFYPFQFALERIKKAGTSIFFSQFLEDIWFLTPSLTSDYYAYPGEYPDHNTGKIYYSATVIVLNMTPRPFISYSQFKSTFGSLLNKSGKPYSRSQNIASNNSRPIVHANGILAIII